VAPITAHSAFNKGCQYFGLKLISVPVNEKTFVADVAAMRRAITPNTVALVASATNFPHGILDPVAELSAIAVEHGIGLHVDACLGGFVIPFMKKNG
jgi:sphinganine-1-phosphate aldolase